MRIFLRVVEDGSFTAAAKRLRLPKSSVSRGVSALEKALGVRLLQRTTRALHLTDAGQAYFQEIRPALSSLWDSTAAASARGVEPRGVVRISCPPYSDDFMAGYVARFKRKYPMVQVDVAFSSRHVDLVGEGLDLALRAGLLKDSDVVARKIHPSELGLFASPSYLRKRKAPRLLEDLRDHDCIGINAPSGRASWKLTGPAGEEAVEVTCPINTDLMQFAGRAAAAGLGIALLPVVFAAGTELLARVLPLYTQTGGTLSVVSPSRAYEPRAVTVFKEGLVEELAQLTEQRCSKESHKLLSR